MFWWTDARAYDCLGNSNSATFPETLEGGQPARTGQRVVKKAIYTAVDEKGENRPEVRHRGKQPFHPEASTY